MHNPFSRNSVFNYYQIIFSLALIRFVMMALMLVFLAPKQPETKAADNRDRGALRIEITWESDKDVDVDLWVQTPGDRPVGWSNKNGKHFDLVRDDLGKLNNSTGIHYEIVYGRDTPPGEYVINVHLYANREPGYARVPVNAIITTTKDDTGKSSQQVAYTRSLVLTRVGEEQTIVRFTVDNQKQLLKESFNLLFKPIYTNK